MGTDQLRRSSGPTLTVAQMNMWNLFDTVRDAHDRDDSVLSPEQYRIKLDKIAAAIVELGTPDIVSANEIENERVLTDLAATDALKGAGYQVVIRPTNDQRGINVAALYRADKLEVANVEQPNPTVTFDRDSGTGQTKPSLLYARAPLVVDFRVKGAAQATDGSDLLTVAINHFRSKVGYGSTAEERRRNADASEARRQLQGKYLGDWFDARATTRPTAATLVLGDLNATYADGAYRNLALRADGSERFYDAPLRVPEAQRYSYWFAKKGDMLDHIMVDSAKRDAINAVSILHVNANKDPYASKWKPGVLKGFSDHDPTVAEFDLTKLMAPRV